MSATPAPAIVSLFDLARGDDEGSDAMSISSASSSAGSSSDSSGGAEEVQEDRWLCCWCSLKHCVAITSDVGARCSRCGHVQCPNCWEYSRVANWVIGIPGGGLIGDEEEEEDDDDDDDDDKDEGEEREVEAKENALP